MVICIGFITSFLPFVSLSGAEQFRVLGGDITSYAIDGLQPDDSVIVGVSPVIDGRVGEAVTVTARTTGSLGTVTGLRVIEYSSSRILISWAPVSRATGYKITWRRSDGTGNIFTLLHYRSYLMLTLYAV